MSQAERGLALLGLGSPGTQAGTLADLSIGARDGALLSLREAMFGAGIEGCADCPACGETMELNFSTHDLASSTPRSDAPIALAAEGYDVTLRRVTTRDLLARDSGDARRGLLARCLIAAKQGETDVTAAALPTPVIDAASQALAKADPQADIQLSIGCSACGHGWQAPFDIVSYLWSELESWAVRTLRDVHTLARAYGWREADILAMSPARRKFYLEMTAP
ncbi:MAG TPA: hypothetical protein VGF56_04440 [Rhizomicrobium sp.]